jgi:hypothetical protein
MLLQFTNDQTLTVLLPAIQSAAVELGVAP